MWYWHDGGGGWWWFIFPIIFMVFIMIMMFWMMRGGGPMGMMGGGHRHGTDGETAGPARSSRDGSGPRETPLEVAQRRYASGEIRREEYERIRDDLS